MITAEQLQNTLLARGYDLLFKEVVCAKNIGYTMVTYSKANNELINWFKGMDGRIYCWDRVLVGLGEDIKTTLGCIREFEANALTGIRTDADWYDCTGVDLCSVLEMMREHMYFGPGTDTKSLSTIKMRVDKLSLLIDNDEDLSEQGRLTAELIDILGRSNGEVARLEALAAWNEYKREEASTQADL